MVNLPDSAVKVAAPFVASTFAPPLIVKLPVFAVTFTVLPEIVPPIIPVALVTLASPVFASIFEFALVIKSLVALTLTVLPEIAPPISPDWLEVVTLSVPLIVELSWVVNLPLSAVMVTALPETLLTLSVSPFAVIFTLPEVDLTSPLISPVLAVTSTLPVVALMVASALVVSFSDAVIFTVLLEVMLFFTSTFFAAIVKPALLPLPSPVLSVLPDVSTLLFSVTL
ncbi:hypothetical protein BVZ52_01776 [Haemophilus influenzae]|nr:hypothetical protein BVZ51_01427 [Haemophilus influenzae]PRI32638.1 hypothetical protein BVZ52_01776 [Haemophilus influenzae]PRJ04367.1 hypothetical protein BV039_00585 [Haemophilus influenzae]